MGIKINVYNQKAEKVSDVDLKKSVFGVEINSDLVHQAFVAQQANERQVLAHTKDRSEVRGGGRKPWKQKGTGRARVGSSNSPIWRGGGVTFGPTKDANYSKKINIKMKKKAFLMVLSDKVANNGMIILDKLEAKEYKTKVFNEILNNIEKKVLKNEGKRSMLVINSANDNKVRNSVRNLANTKIISLDNINIVDLLKHKNVVLTEDAIKVLETRYNK